MVTNTRNFAFLICGGLVLAATAAVAGSGVGSVFHLGQPNTVNAQTALGGSTTASQLYVANGSTSLSSRAILGFSGAATGVTGVTNSRIGVNAQARGTTGTNYGVYATSASFDGIAGFFMNTNTTYNSAGVAVQGLGVGGAVTDIHPKGDFIDAGGEFAGPNGVIGAAAWPGGYGVIGIQGRGEYALYTLGNANINGRLSKSSGTFKIDHPLDPANKYLSHSFVESPDMMNIYNGNITTDGSGTAVVEMPSYFEALNRDPRYQLTVIGSPATAYVSREIRAITFEM